MTVRSLAALAALVLASCPGSVLPQYEKARTEALSDPGPAPPDWQPDVVLQLSPALVDTLVQTALEEEGTLKAKAIEVPVVGGRLSPSLTVDALELSSSKDCDDCLAVDATVSGDVRWALGGRSGTTPVDGTVAFDLAVDATGEDGVFVARLQPRQVRRVKLRVGEAQAEVGRLAQAPLEAWLRDDLLTRVPPFEIGPFGSEGLPLRAFRIAPSPRGIAMAMLTSSPSPEAVEVRPARLTEGFTVEISEDSLLDLARREAFRLGEVGYDVVVEPTALDLGSDTFTLGIRLWRVKGKGWWRDYTVEGTLEPAKRGIRLEATGVTEGEKSPGAAVVDPLAALGEGYILKTIEQSVAMSLPSSRRSKIGDASLDIRVNEVVGRGDTVLLRGDVVVGGGGDARKKPERGGDDGSMTRPR